MKIVIIDSGYSGTPCNCNAIDGLAISEENGHFVYKSEYTDKIGHGTSVVNVILDHLTVNVDLFIIKIFDKELKTNINTLIAALKVCKQISCDIIQVSLGILYSSELLHDIIHDLSKKSLIISAFDNQNGLSYPAAYEEVLGVDVSMDIRDKNEFFVNSNNIIDIRGMDAFFRVRSLQQKTIIVHGSSFLCSYVTSLLANHITTVHSKKDALNMLSQTVKVINKGENCCTQPPVNRVIKIEKAIVFPFNKEIFTIAAYEDCLGVTILDYYDVRQAGHVNCRICDLLKYTSNNKVVKDYANINWNDSFDTIICGHIGNLCKLLKKDILGDIVQQCIKHKKQLVCFDDISEYMVKYPNLVGWFPCMEKSIVPTNRYGKLRSPSVPIVGIFGTSSRQGKMSLQIRLRDKLKKIGIRVKNIGSEPQSFLFGFEFSYVFGYNAVDMLNSYEMIQVLNEAVFQLEEKNCDIIIVGSQSGTIPHQLRNLNMIPLKQYYFLLGTQPDSIILVVNSCDSLEYIKRTISFFQSTVCALVICLIWTNINESGNNTENVTVEELRSYFNIPTFDLKTLDIDEIAEVVLKHYE